MVRGRFLQLLDVRLPPCCPYPPRRSGRPRRQRATCHAAFAPKQRARPPDSIFSRPPLGSLALRPGDLLAIPNMALSVGFIPFVSSADATQATKRPDLSPVGPHSPGKCQPDLHAL